MKLLAALILAGLVGGSAWFLFDSVEKTPGEVAMSSREPVAIDEAAGGDLHAFTETDAKAAEVLQEIQRQYADMALGTVVSHETHPMADIYLVRSAHPEDPVAKIIVTYERDIDTGENIID